MALIDLRDIYKVYDMGAEKVHALNGVDLTVERGEYVAIMGSSGSGKSTLMNLVGCLDTPTSGSYILNGTAVQELDDTQLAAIRNKEIGFVFQTFNLLARTDALHNVELPLLYNAGKDKLKSSERHKRAKEVLEIVGLGKRMDHYPNQLSGGQQQRVAVARAVAGDPRILLADEPTGNLDSRNGDAVMALLEEMHGKGATICMVTHNPDYARKATRVVHLFDGRVVEDRRG